ncbi:NIPSNAP protein [Novymonas esmeraldas]|uniref:NIPSNAP protein n=1 Tax=Novymonas esmeraldas TaxID=1808958 RepID=A0AAW0EUY6_9TRYP
MLRLCAQRLKGAGSPSHVYELRTHIVAPDKYDSFHQLCMKHMPQRPPIGSCQGCWTVQLGGVNQFFQIWRYESLKHRYDCRKQLEQDQEWSRTFGKPADDMIISKSNSLLRLVYREGNASMQSYKYLIQCSPHEEVELSGPSAILAATFQVVVGEEEGKYIHLVKGHNLDDVIPVRPTLGCSSKIMGPVRWSATMNCLWR